MCRVRKESDIDCVEITQAEIVERMEIGAFKRLSMTAEDMVRAFRAGDLEDWSYVIDLISMAGMLDTDHPLFIDP